MRWIVTLITLMTSLGYAMSSLSGNPAQAAAPTFKKVMFIIFENADYETAMAQPYFSKIASEGALLSNLHAEAHPSQPNYVALISGSNKGVTSDSPVNLSRNHIGNLLEAQGKSWKVYAEAYPGGCYLGTQSGTYVRKHVPFVSFTDVQKTPAKCERIVNASVLQTDMQNGTLPDYSLYIPDLNNDGHDTGAAYADRWLSQTFDPLLHNRQLMQDMLVVLTFDESETSNPTNHIYSVLYGDSVIPGSVSSNSYDHYSLLRTVEDTLGIGTLGLSDATATPVSDVWK